MKLHLINPFVAWVLKKIVVWLVNINRNYRKMLERETGAAVFLFLLLSMSATALGALAGVIASNGSGVVAAYSAGTVFTLSIAYFLYQSFSVMFVAFKKDRQELFNRLKD